MATDFKTREHRTATRTFGDKFALGLTQSVDARGSGQSVVSLSVAQERNLTLEIGTVAEARALAGEIVTFCDGVKARGWD